MRSGVPGTKRSGGGGNPEPAPCRRASARVVPEGAVWPALSAANDSSYALLFADRLPAPSAAVGWVSACSLSRPTTAAPAVQPPVPDAKAGFAGLSRAERAQTDRMAEHRRVAARNVPDQPDFSRVSGGLRAFYQGHGDAARMLYGAALRDANLVPLKPSRLTWTVCARHRAITRGVTRLLCSRCKGAWP